MDRIQAGLVVLLVTSHAKTVTVLTAHPNSSLLAAG